MFAANAGQGAGTPAQYWYPKSGPARSFLQGAYANGTYLYLGTGGYLATSTDANTWAESTTLRSAVLSTNTYSLRYIPFLNGFAAGGAGRIGYSSNNGATWVSNFIPSWSGASVQAVIASNSIIVAYGNSGRIATSTNGTTWTDRGFMSTLAGWNSGAGGYSPYTADFGNGLIMLVGWNISPSAIATCATSPDGLNWTNRPNLNVASSGAWVNAIKWSPALGKWFAGFNGGLMAVSSDDGANWSMISGAATALGGENVSAIAEVNGTLVVFAGNNKVITSRDGVTWVSQPGLSNIGVITTSYGQNGGLLFVAQTNTFAVSV